MSAKSDAMYALIQQAGTGMINKAMNQSNQELQIALGLLQNEQNLTNQYKSALLEKGLQIPGGVSSGFETFVDSAGDSSTANSLGALYAEAKLNNDLMIQSFNDYNAGRALGDSLRSEGLASIGTTDDAGQLIPDDPYSLGSYTFNSEELDNLTSGPNPSLTEEQRNNANFMIGMNLSQNEALKMIQIDQQIADNATKLQANMRIENEAELTAIVNQKNQTMALVSSIITDRLELKGINVSYFKDLGIGDNAPVKIEQFQKQVEQIVEQFPYLGDEIARAMNIYAAPESMAHTRHHGFIQMGINQHEIKKKMGEIEYASINDPKIRNSARIELDPNTGQMTDDSVERLVRYFNNNNQYEYGELVGKFDDYTKLGLHLDESSLSKFQKAMEIEDGIEEKRMSFLNELLGESAPNDPNDLNLLSAEDWRANLNLLVDDMYDNFETNDLTGDEINQFSLNYEEPPTEISNVVNALNNIESAKGSYRDAMSKVQSSMSSLYVFDGNMDPDYIPSADEVQEVAVKLSKQINNMNKVGKDSGPFGLYKTTESDVMNNQDRIKYLISVYDEYILQYNSMTGLQMDLFNVRNSAKTFNFFNENIQGE